MPLSLLFAQNTLSVDEAIQIALENNYGIKIARISADIASTNKTLGNSGFLPSISASGTRTERFNETIETETEVSSSLIEDATTTITNANLSLNWTIFDGLQMFATWDRLGEIEKRSREELRLEMESTVSDIILLYYNIVSLNDQLTILENSVEVSLERLEIVETELDLGSSSKFDLLQAQSDLNADRAAVLREANRLTEAKILLNEVMGRDATTEIEVADPIEINRLLEEQSLMQNVLSENTELTLARSEETIAEQEVREIRGERYPELVLNSGYSFNRNESTGGFTTFFETSGLSVGLTARINLFNGFNTNRRINVAKLNVKSAQYRREEIRQQLLSNFNVLYQTYLNSINLVDLEEENLENAEETLEIALERFRLGTISAIEFRESQRTFLLAESRLIQAKFEAKQSETELLRLSGRLQDLLIETL
ncbi:MAG TPA: TolC family protein [Balneolaceae bacterium]|nr:TolC family protein [Balneolaceae bacterium]